MYIDEKVAILLRRKLRILQTNLQSDILAKVSSKIVCLDAKSQVWLIKADCLQDLLIG